MIKKILSLAIFISAMAAILNSRANSAEKPEECIQAAAKIAKLNCQLLPALATQLAKLGEIPPDGDLCKKATTTYDRMASMYYQCAEAGTSSPGSCLALCRNVDKQKTTLCYQASREAQKIRFDSIKTPSCEFAQNKVNPDPKYIETSTIKAKTNGSAGFKPIEEVAAPNPASNSQ